MYTKNIIKLSQTWIAALFLGLLLSGCGGGSGQTSQTSSGGGQESSGGGQESSGGGQESVDRTAALSWNAPFTRENGEALAMGELAGYFIKYGQDPAALSETVQISEASEMEYTITNLDDGTWYFTVQAEDLNGLVSAPSAKVSKAI